MIEVTISDNEVAMAAPIIPYLITNNISNNIFSIALNKFNIWLILCLLFVLKYSILNTPQKENILPIIKILNISIAWWYLSPYREIIINLEKMITIRCAAILSKNIRYLSL
jgi:hypothetical protein